MWRQDDLFNVIGAGGNALLGIPPATSIEELVAAHRPAAPGPVDAHRLPADARHRPVLDADHHDPRRARSSPCRRASSTPWSCGTRSTAPRPTRSSSSAWPSPARCWRPSRPTRPLGPLHRHAHQFVGRDVEPGEQARPAAPLPRRRSFRQLRLVGGGGPGRLGSPSGAAAGDRPSSRSARTAPCSPRTAARVAAGLRRARAGGRQPASCRVGYYKDEEKTAKTFRTIEGRRWSVPGRLGRGAAPTAR